MDLQQPLAVVGAACRLPGAATLPALAELLLAGRSAISTIPDGRWTVSRYFHPVPGHPGKTYSFAAGCLTDILGFDAAFFGITPREAVSIDPQQRLMLELAHEALQDAGQLSSRLAGSYTGVFIGASSWDFAATSFADAAGLDAYGMQGAALSSVANRISYVFGLRGSSLTVDTACSSSLVALHLACQALSRGEMSQAIVGGVNLLLAPQSFVGFARASMLSRLGRCHAFDARADGYVRGEGGGALVLKTLAGALADGDPIRAVIRGTGVNSDGRTNGFSVPNGDAQAALIRQVCASAGVAQDQFSYFEAHGTGTPVGDPIEAHAIGQAVAQGRRTRLPIGSVKSNIGHLEPASGMAGLMKLLVVLDQGVIPASLNFATPNPNIPFADLNLEVVTEPRPLTAAGTDALVGINSFGFGGTNAHAVLTGPPPVPLAAGPAVPETTTLPLLLSARCADGLRALAGAWKNTIDTTPADSVPALLRGAARHRDQYPHRLVIHPPRTADLGRRIAAWLEHGAAPDVWDGQSNGQGVAFVYSGNGSQWAGMGLDALRSNASFRAALADVDKRLATVLGWSVTARLASDDLAETLRHTEIAQPLLFAIQVGIVAALHGLGVRPVAHVGHSAGEVAAAWASGALTLDQACHVIIQRSLLQGATHGAGGMATLGLAEAPAREMIAGLDPRLAIAAVNAARSVTIAGPDESLILLGQAAQQAGCQFSRLDLDYAFHSPAMDPICAPLLEALDGLVSATPHETMVSTVTAETVSQGTLDAAYWWHNVRRPVRFQQAIRLLRRDGVCNFLEIGPQPVLQSYLRDALASDMPGTSPTAGGTGQVLATLSRRPQAGDALTAAAAQCHIAGADLSGAACFDGTVQRHGLPLYPFQRRRHAAARTTEAVEVIAPSHDHPLLGFRDPAVRNAWMAHLSVESEPWLAHHKVDGSVVLPAAAIIEMALATVRLLHPDATSLEIQDLEINRALVLAPNSITDCRTDVTPDGQWQLSSRARLSADSPQRHASCHLLAGLSQRPILPHLQADDAETIHAASVYAAAHTLRLEYGEAFRTVRHVHRISPLQGVASLEGGDPGGTRAECLLDPAVLDGALQALLVMAVGEPRVTAMGTILPWRFGRIRLLRAVPVTPKHAHLQVRHVGPRSICADLALTDSAGVTVMELLDCWFVATASVTRPVADQSFWTAYVPSARQPATTLADPIRQVIAAVPAVVDPPEGVLLADACVVALAYEALRALADGNRLAGRVAEQALAATALRWLQDYGLACLRPDGWHLVAGTHLPDAAEIWRTVFFSSNEAAVGALLAAIGPALAAADPTALVLSAALREEALFAAPTASRTITALTNGLDAVIAAWPARTCLRVAVVGALHPPLLRRLHDRIQARGIALRLVALTAAADALAGVQDVMAKIPGGSARLWGTRQDELCQAFDLVIDLYGFSLPSPQGLTPAELLPVLVPTGVLLCAEPLPGRTAELLFGPGMAAGAVATLRDPRSWCDELRGAGFSDAHATGIFGTAWAAGLLVATVPASPSLDPLRLPGAGAEPSTLIVFAAPNDPLASALSARQGVLHVLPLAAMRKVLTAPFAARQEHVLLLTSTPAEDDDQTEGLIELLTDISRILQGMAQPHAARLWLVSNGTPAGSLISAALSGLRRVAANELPGLVCHAIALDPGLTDDEGARCVLLELADPDLETEVLWHRFGRMVPRLRAGLPDAPLADGPRRLAVGRPGLIGSLAWRPMDPPSPNDDEIAIEVHAAALNFRDVMWVQGLLPDEALLSGFSGASLGLECAGVVTAVGAGVTDLRPGDRVAAVAPAAMATHVVTRRNGVLPVPPDMAFAAAATLPVAFMTAAYALGELARLAKHETVLIHGGAGAVGLAAIQFALHRGAVVYATAGSEMRRQTLRMIGVAAAFDSRDSSFVDEVLAATGGRGVDVVLNCVSQQLMKQSLRLLRPFGRFLEIGKRDLYGDTAVGLRVLRHNASYFAIDVDELVAQRPDIGQRVLNQVSDLLKAGELHPLPYRSFGFNDAVAAFRLLQASGHIGKVVLLPEPTRSAVQPPPLRLRADAVYIVTGGLAGFGLETACWLARHGAGKLALISRRGIRTPGSDTALATLRSLGANAQAFACDVAEPAALQGTLQHIRASLGPIAGVFHAAMVLDDGLLHDLDAARFAAVIRPKLDGALTLDRLTRDDPIELFVLFSSVTTVIGTPGQASYVAANRTLEALAERRAAEGLPALAVQWGPIADAGYLVRETRVSKMLATMLGSEHLRASQALDALPALIAAGCPVIGLAEVAWSEICNRLPGLAGAFWSEMPAHDRSAIPGRALSVRLAEMAPHEAEAEVQAILLDEIGRILQLPASSIRAGQPLHEFGVDSLMAVELQTALESRLGLAIPPSVLSGAESLTAIAERLLHSMRRPETTGEAEDAVLAAIMRHEPEAPPAPLRHDLVMPT